jgi:hypothetical protein
LKNEISEETGEELQVNAALILVERPLELVLLDRCR